MTWCNVIVSYPIPLEIIKRQPKLCYLADCAPLRCTMDSGMITMVRQISPGVYSAVADQPKVTDMEKWLPFTEPLIACTLPPKMTEEVDICTKEGLHELKQYVKE